MMTGKHGLEEKKPLWQRLGWLLLIWAMSVAALGVAAYVMRLAGDRAVNAYLRALRITNFGVAATCSTPRNNRANLL